MKKRKIGIILILIGIGIPAVMSCFMGYDEDWFIKLEREGVFHRKLTSKEISDLKEVTERVKKEDNPLLSGRDESIRKIIATYFQEKEAWDKNNFWSIVYERRLIVPFRTFLAIGVLTFITGIGFIIFSFFPKKQD